MEAKEEEKMRNIRLMILAGVVLNFVYGLLGPLLVVFIQQIGSENLLDIGYVYAAFLITSGVFSTISGRLSDKYGRKKLILFGAAIAAFVPFGYIFATGVYQVLFLQFVAGISLGINLSPFLALYSESTKKTKRGFHFGLFDLMVSIAGGVAVLIGAYIVQYFGFVNLFLLMGFLSIINFLVLTRITESKK